MRKILIATALASSALAGSARADDTGPYITIEGGVVAQRHVAISDGGGYQQTDAFKHGWEAGGAVGYDFGHFRLEAEAFHDNSVLKSQSRPTGTTPPNGYYDQSSGLYGRTRTNAFMGNVLFGLGHWGGVKVYAGGGAGYADTFLFDNLASSGIISGHDHGFAWQGIAGLTVPVSHSVDLGVKYRYFDPSGANQFGYSDGTTRQGTLRSHSLLATLTFNFGSHTAPAPEVAMAPPPPPPPPAPPPPPPPPPVVAPVCNTGPYIVFFDWDKSAISPEAANILDSAIQAYGNCGTVPITLAGYTDSSGTARYNLGLAARRDTSVQAYLTGHGIAATSITSHAYGEANQRVPTADGVRELQNRRVEITYGTGAGN